MNLRIKKITEAMQMIIPFKREAGERNDWKEHFLMPYSSHPFDSLSKFCNDKWIILVFELKTFWCILFYFLKKLKFNWEMGSGLVYRKLW